ncbi:MAG: ion transporter [Lysobacterales bacterium]
MAQLDFEAATTRGWRAECHRIIFGHSRRDERLFDVALIVLILFSVLIAMLDSVAEYDRDWGQWLRAAEWGATILFTIEYLVRLAVVRHPWRYARSFFGVIDLLAVLPTYLSLLLVGAQHLIVIRVLRILRVFRILKLSQYVGEASVLLHALYHSRRKVLVFVISVVSLATVFGAVMYLVEGPENGFTSIPRGVYWAIVTMATVGFGDIVPKTGLGQAITTVIIIIGYGIIAVPTGIFTAAMVSGRSRKQSPECARCGLEEHADDARYCRRCGDRLASASPESPA